MLVAGQSPGTLYGLDNVGDVPISPQPNLVAEDAKPARPATADGSCGDHAALLATQVHDRRLLDHVPRPGDLDLKRGVVKVARWTPLDLRHQRFEPAAVQPDEAPACPERQPVQVNGCAAWLIASTPLWASRVHIASISSCFSNPWADEAARAIAQARRGAL